MTWHSALIPQLQGSTQSVLWQALSNGHSSSDWHPTGTGSGGGNMHSIWGSPIYPAGQAHFALWKITLQNALGAQGSSYAQGFLHAPFKQAAYSGHSELLLQPTTTSNTMIARRANSIETTLFNSASIQTGASVALF